MNNYALLLVPMKSVRNYFTFKVSSKCISISTYNQTKGIKKMVAIIFDFGK